MPVAVHAGCVQGATLRGPEAAAAPSPTGAVVLTPEG